MKANKILFLILLALFPFPIFAYSNKVYVGGETIGIEVHSQGVYVVDFYPVHNQSIGRDAGFQVGDIIQSIDGQKVESIHSLNHIISDEKDYIFQVLRNNKNVDIPLKVLEEDSLLKTGLYVKDMINGIGTLSYIDPETKIYGSLGHEILESSSFSKFRLKDGLIYKAEVSSIKRGNNVTTGEKNAVIDKSQPYGDVRLNEQVGIFGKYDDSFDGKELLEVGSIDQIHNGDAYIRIVVSSNKINEYRISILSLDEGSSSKNILFEITDTDLIKKTGGIIQGMSGSPIIQDQKIIGVVNYVIIDDCKRGYGVFITKMLEEGDKIMS